MSKLWHTSRFVLALENVSFPSFSPIHGAHVARNIPRHKPKRPDVFMTQGPTFEKVCALVIWARAQEMFPERARVHFEDLDGTPPEGMPDIDVRMHYPMGSSAFEQQVLAFQPSEAEDFAALANALNQNNATGYLKEGEYQRWSLVRLIRKSYDLRNPKAFTIKSWRQKVIKKFLPVAETIVLFHLVAPELDTPEARKMFAFAYPEVVNLGSKRNSLSPFTLPGYAYAQWLLWPTSFDQFLRTEFRYWKKQFEEIRRVRRERVNALRAAKHPIYKCEFTQAWILCIEPETDQDASAAFEAYPDVDIIVVRDLRPQVPRLAILPRETRPIVREMYAIHMALHALEPESWYPLTRPSGMTFLLNGSTSRAPKVPSALARTEAAIMGTILLTLEDLWRRHQDQTDLD